MALMIGCIWHGLDALQGTRAKPGNHLVSYNISRRYNTCSLTSHCIVGPSIAVFNMPSKRRRILFIQHKSHREAR